MSDRCDRCGVTALAGEHFGQERYPFFRAKRYCPACQRRLHKRINLWTLVGAFVFGVWTLWRKDFSDAEWRRWNVVWYLGILGLQYLLVLPHELGHAVMARLLRFDKIRIVIGSGKPVFSINFLGFPWLFRLFPFGGITLVDLAGKKLRWRALVMVAAGPAINVGLAVIAWFLIPSGTLFNGGWTFSKILLAANVILIAASLVPYMWNTSFGQFPSDGLQIWTLLFRWNKPVRDRGIQVPGWQVLLCHILKWIAASASFSGVLIFLYAGYFVFSNSGGRRTGAVIGVAALLLLSFIALFGWMTFWIIKQPIAKQRELPAPRLSLIPMDRELNAEQASIYSQLAKNFNGKNFTQAEAACDQLLGTLPDRERPVYAKVLELKLACMVQLGKVEAAEALSTDFVRQGSVSSLGIQVLDGVACALFYTDRPVRLEVAERVARLAVQLAPREPSVKGTLGAILAEQGRFAEAESLLRQCLEQSDAFHDQAISSFYLGVTRQATGRRQEAKELMKRALVLYSPPWLTAKVQAHLRELG